MADQSELEALYREAQSALKAKDYDHASNLLRQILKADVDYKDAAQLLARVIKLSRRRWYNDPRLWGALGAILAPEGKRLQTGIGLALTSPLLDHLIPELERQRQIASQRERLNKLRDALQSWAARSIEAPASQTVPSATTQAAHVEPDAQWRNVIVHPSIVLILGKRGSGKSALGYRLLELFRWVATPYVVGIPSAASTGVPDFHCRSEVRKLGDVALIGYASRCSYRWCSPPTCGTGTTLPCSGV